MDRIEPPTRPANINPVPKVVFDAEFQRIGYGFRTLRIEAATAEEARKKALDIAGNFDYTEKESRYETLIPYRASDQTGAVGMTAGCASWNCRTAATKPATDSSPVAGFLLADNLPGLYNVNQSPHEWAGPDEGGRGRISTCHLA